MFVEFLTPKQQKITINTESIYSFWADEAGTVISIGGRTVTVQENYEEVSSKVTQKE